MSATNTWWLGRANPTRFALGDTNLEYQQNFLALAAELERRGIDSIGVAMPAVSAAELACYLPQAPPRHAGNRRRARLVRAQRPGRAGRARAPRRRPRRPLPPRGL
jgi:hypothetical protein